ncbi:hypothetical protein FQN53_009066 [Emmonsiellopsis sp. PD_33]|nr:hypothetical protein FQN53_009066 [Emmonsiellopsis sp. PD_33]
MAIEITRLTKEDIPSAVECVQKAFEDDPYFLWVFDAATFSKSRNAASLTARCLWGINNGLFYAARELPKNPSPSSGDLKQQPPSRLVGVAMWLPPHPTSQPETWYSYFQSWVLSFRQLVNNIRYLGHGGLNVKRYWIWKSCQQVAQREIWTDPRGYYFCNVIAVTDDMRGKGIGRRLVEVVTDQADKEGMRCYLESSKNVPNLEIYGRMGFQTVKEMDCKDNEGVCKLYCMTREPKPTSMD